MIVWSHWVRLATFAVSLDASVPEDRLIGATVDVIDVVDDHGPLPLSDDPTEARERTEDLLALWSYRESGWKAGALGDQGRSIGAMQVNRAYTAPWTAAEVLGSRRIGLLLGLHWMAVLIEKCGSIRAGLGAYAAGRCTSYAESAEVRWIVDSRLAASGVR